VGSRLLGLARGATRHRDGIARELVPLVYTVNDVQRMRELMELGVAGVFTDHIECGLRADDR
jgi:glycerophosphoryl diester phosphodiesterase